MHCDVGPHFIVVVSHLSVRQTSDMVQGPSPSASPHRLSLSQTPYSQTRLPTALEQVATLDGVVGSGFPLAILGSHIPSATPSAELHQSPVTQSESTRQPLVHT